MSVSLASPDGRVVGGGVAGLLVAASPVQVINILRIHANGYNIFSVFQSFMQIYFYWKMVVSLFNLLFKPSCVLKFQAKVWHGFVIQVCFTFCFNNAKLVKYSRIISFYVKIFQSRNDLLLYTGILCHIARSICVIRFIFIYI